MLQSPDVSDFLSSQLGHGVLQSVCKIVFNQLKRFFAGKEQRLPNWFAAALWLGDEASRRSPFVHAWAEQI